MLLSANPGDAAVYHPEIHPTRLRTVDTSSHLAIVAYDLSHVDNSPFCKFADESRGVLNVFPHTYISLLVSYDVVPRAVGRVTHCCMQHGRRYTTKIRRNA